MSDDSDWKFKMSLAKVAVVYLNTPLDFHTWHISLRRLVSQYNMVSSLMFSVPENKILSLKKKVAEESVKREKVEKEKQEVEQKKKEDSGPRSVSPTRALPAVTYPSTKSSTAVDLTAEPLVATPLDVEMKNLMASMGISASMDEFFSSTTRFVIMPAGTLETEKQIFFRQEIWSWIESSLSKGSFKWLVRTISPTYDIHTLYHKIVSLANKATWISHALEFRKLFTMSNTGDIFQYHADLIQQIKLVRTQGEALGITADVPPWMEQSLLLIAAWQNTQYRKIALEFTMKDQDVPIEALVKELQKQQLLTEHLNQSGGKAEHGRRGREADAQVQLVSGACCETTQALFPITKKGSCSKGASCPFSHNVAEQKAPTTRTPAGGQATPSGEPSTQPVGQPGSGGAKKMKKSQPKGKQGGGEAQPSDAKGGEKCKNCGTDRHLTSECTFAGACNYCGRDGHKELVCRKKAADERASAKVAVAAPEDAQIRMLMVPERFGGQRSKGNDVLANNIEHQVWVESSVGVITWTSCFFKLFGQYFGRQ